MINSKAPHFPEKVFERLLSIACNISLPLICLFAVTITMSLITTGGINTNINEASDLPTVLFSFSFPMFTSLAVIPLIFKMCLQKRSAKDLGLAVPTGAAGIVSCLIMTAGTVVLAVLLSTVPGLNVSPLTVWLHFFFVAVSEEIILRSVIMDELRCLTGNRWLLCLLNGVIFAFIYHSNEGFWPNLLVRVPLGFVLSLVREKSGSVYPAVTLHWLYNMLVTTI